MEGFTRTMLANCHQELRVRFPGVKARNASVTCSHGGGGNKQYFFQFRQSGYEPFDCWVSAHDAYDARCKGWDQWMQKMGGWAD